MTTDDVTSISYKKTVRWGGGGNMGSGARGRWGKGGWGGLEGGGKSM